MNVPQLRLVDSSLIGSLLFCGRRSCLQNHARRIRRHPLQTDPETREMHQAVDKGRGKVEGKARDQVGKRVEGKVEDNEIGVLEVFTGGLSGGPQDEDRQISLKVREEH